MLFFFLRRFITGKTKWNLFVLMLFNEHRDRDPHDLRELHGVELGNSFEDLPLARCQRYGQSISFARFRRHDEDLIRLHHFASSLTRDQVQLLGNSNKATLQQLAGDHR
jgi:hypothetical protein